jgi:hypothetical protein
LFRVVPKSSNPEIAPQAGNGHFTILALAPDLDPAHRSEFPQVPIRRAEPLRSMF